MERRRLNTEWSGFRDGGGGKRGIISWRAAQDPTDADDFAARTRGAVDSGERRLMLAVLEDAIRRYQGRVIKVASGERFWKAQQEEAVAWFASTSRERLFAFESICEWLGLSAMWIRKKLAAKDAQRRLSRTMRIVSSGGVARMVGRVGGGLGQD